MQMFDFTSEQRIRLKRTMLNCWNCCRRALACAGDNSPEATPPSRDGDGGDGEWANQCGDPAAGLSCDGARDGEAASLVPGDDDDGSRCPTAAYNTCAAGAYGSEPVSVTKDGTAALVCCTGLTAGTGECAVVTTAVLTELYCVIP